MAKKRKTLAKTSARSAAKKTVAMSDEEYKRAKKRAALRKYRAKVRRNGGPLGTVGRPKKDGTRAQRAEFVPPAEPLQNTSGSPMQVRNRYKGSLREGFTQYIFGADYPEESPFTTEMLDKVALRIMWFDQAGIPHDARYRPLFGKRDIEIALGKKGFRGSRFEEDTKVTGIVRSTRPEEWDFALPNWEEVLMRKQSLVPPKVKAMLNKELALKAVRVFNELKLSDVPGTPTLGEAAGDWFREIVEVIIGSYDSRTRKRMIRELFLLVPKKNMKTTGGALIMLLLLIFNERPKGQAIMTAPVHDVADIAFEAISGAIALDPDLTRIFEVKEHFKTVIDRRNEAELRVLTFDPAVLTGQKLFAALVDELHVIAKNPKAASALRQIRGGMLPFPEAILIFITTQSEEAPAGVFLTELSLARATRDGTRKGGKLLPILYEFPRELQEIRKDGNQPWRDPDLWDRVTPNIGRSIALETLVSSYNDAEQKGEAEIRSWASQHLNIEIGLALRSNSWAGAPLWMKAETIPTLTLEELLKRSEVVDLGIDGGGMDDLLGLAAIGREKETNRWLVWTKAWAHPIVLERNKQIAAQLLDFQKSGDLVIVEKAGADLEELIDLIVMVEKSGLLDKIGLDPYGVGVIVDAILAEGIEPEKIVGVSQGWRMSGAVKTIERTVAEGKMVHGNQKILNWNVGNAQIETKGNATLITKAASGSAKIDLLMAVLDAVSLMAANPAPRNKKFQMFILGGNKPSVPPGAAKK